MTESATDFKSGVIGVSGSRKGKTRGGFGGRGSGTAIETSGASADFV